MKDSGHGKGCADLRASPKIVADNPNFATI